jgi:hypothetical protein
MNCYVSIPKHGLWLDDVIRSSLWWGGVWKPNQETDADLKRSYKPDLDYYDPDKVSSTRYLTDYGNVPGTFHLPVCRN